MVNLGYAGFLVAAAVLPEPDSGTGLPAPDWLLHGLAYGVQAVLLSWASAPSVGPNRGLLVAWVGASSFGAATEALQLLQPARAFEAVDLVANSVGAAAACATIAALDRVVSGSQP